MWGKTWSQWICSLISEWWLCITHSNGPSLLLVAPLYSSSNILQKINIFPPSLQPTFVVTWRSHHTGSMWWHGNCRQLKKAWSIGSKALDFHLNTGDNVISININISVFANSDCAMLTWSHCPSLWLRNTPSPPLYTDPPPLLPSHTGRESLERTP